MIRICIVALQVIVFSTSAQIFPFRSSLEFDDDSWQRLEKDVGDRTAAIPEDTYALYQEREWVGERIDEISRNLRRGNPYIEGIGKFEGFRLKWLKLSDRLIAIRLGEKEVENELIGDINQFLVELHRTAWQYDFEEREDYPKVLRSKFQSSEAFELQESEVEDSQAQEESVRSLANSNSIREISDFIDTATRLLRDYSAKWTQSAQKMREVLGKLEEYKTKLNSQIAKVQTKDNVSSNLFLMILTIGGLSIAAIALIRLFPEQVMVEWVASGQVIQFVTVMILLSCIMALGLSGLLGENTIGTLLGGIGGYVLSQGVGRSVARQVEKVRGPESH
ncbi:MAG: hypothetical protein KF886_02775 [Candidatus Hydrogenedentes bacterium]|nr:hypothetical protein [Candidatus Hydrogenedentota bacterium]